MSFKKIAGAAAIGLTLIGGATAHAGVLLGAGTLNNAGDLTRIQTNGGELDFLDLSLTAGMTPSAALSLYSGFRRATESDVAELYSAFNITYASAPNLTVELTASTADRANYTSYLGTTYYDATLGYIDVPGFEGAYSCVSINSCGPAAFTYISNAFRPPIRSVGVFLVRGGNAVPEPGTLALLGLGVAGVAALRRRKQ